MGLAGRVSDRSGGGTEPSGADARVAGVEHAGQWRRQVVVALAVAALMAGCGSSEGTAGPTGRAPATTGAQVPPTWTGDGTPEGTVSFADGPELAAASEVTFRNGLADVWDWELVGTPASTTTGVSPPVTLEMVNTGNDCRVLDERAPYEGKSTDDGAASMALVEERLSGAETVAGPSQDLLGLGEAMGEDGATYTVARALGRQSDGQWLLVTARAFVALGAQQVLTVSCPSGAGIDQTRGQLSMVAIADLRGLETLP